MKRKKIISETQKDREFSLFPRDHALGESEIHHQKNLNVESGKATGKANCRYAG